MDAISSDSSEGPQAALQERLIEAVKTVYDPEIPVDIYELGLIYKIQPDENGVVRVEMTLTSPNCPAAASLPGEVEAKILAVPGVQDVDLELVWDPPWDREMMSEVARVALDMY